MLTKEAQLKKLLKDARDRRNDMEKRAAAGEEIGQEEINALDAMIADGRKIKADIEREHELDLLDQYVSEPVTGGQPKRGARGAERKSWGDIVIESAQFKAASEANAQRMDRVQVKAIEGTTELGGGALVQTWRDPELVGIPMQPRSIMDLVTIAQTDSNNVEFARVKTRTDNAAPVLDYNSGFVSKPESNLEFELVQAPVKTIPTYVAAHRHILADAPQLRSLINQELAYMVRLEMEDQMLNGDGTSANFTGILNTAGIQTRTQGSITDRGGEAGDTKADALRRAITDIQLSFYEVTGMLMNPGDAEALELEKSADGEYVNVFDPVGSRIWRVPVVESSIIAAGTALVGNFRLGATLYDRQQTDIRVGEPGDFFLQNAVAVLAELRAAFAVKRPAAFEAVTFA